MFGLFLFYIAFVWRHYPFSIGGSFIFISIIGINSYFSLRHKDLAVELSLFSVMLYSIMIINFLVYFEYQHGYSGSLEILIGFFIFIASIIPWILSIKPINLKGTSNTSELQKELKRRIYYFIGHSSIITSIYAISTLALLSGIRENVSVRKECTLHFTFFSLIWLVLGLLFVLISRRRWDYLDKYISCSIEKRFDINMGWLIKRFRFIAVAIFLIGLAFEAQRGFWFLWLCSWLVLMLSLRMIWLVWQFVMQREIPCSCEVEIERIKNIPSLADPKYFFKFIAANVPLGIFYFIVLILVESAYCN